MSVGPAPVPNTASSWVPRAEPSETHRPFMPLASTPLKRTLLMSLRLRGLREDSRVAFECGLPVLCASSDGNRSSPSNAGRGIRGVGCRRWGRRFLGNPWLSAGKRLFFRWDRGNVTDVHGGHEVFVMGYHRFAA